jgi:hypothetical protein
MIAQYLPLTDSGSRYACRLEQTAAVRDPVVQERLRTNVVDTQIPLTRARNEPPGQGAMIWRLLMELLLWLLLLIRALAWMAPYGLGVIGGLVVCHVLPSGTPPLGKLLVFVAVAAGIALGFKGQR